MTNILSVERLPQTHGEPADDRSPEPSIGDELRPRSFRPDIEGLRAVAILVVVLYHAHLLGVSGGYIGVDVFFVLSGFLITRQLVGNVSRRGIRELPCFYARRIRRLLPASTVVVVATLAASRLWAPALQAKNVNTDALFTIFYGLNYRLALNATDYMHQTDVVSPLQHYWSLGVEEQFYLLWPLIVVLAVALPRVIRRWGLLVILLGIGGTSFYESMTTTVTNPSWAYFSLTCRAWELAAGGLIALTAGLWVYLPRRIADVLALTGLATVIASAFMFNDDTPYPGVLAAFPVAATALMLGCGCAPRFHAIERILAEPVIQGIGKISYGWYLWHWPMLIIATTIAGGTLAWPRRVEIVLLSMLAAILSLHVVENPVRRLKRTSIHWMRLGAVLGCVVMGVSVISSNTIRVTGQGAATYARTIDVAKPGLEGRMASLLVNSVSIREAPVNLTPKLAQAQYDVAPSWSSGCLLKFTALNNQPGCVYGDPKGTHTAVLFGDSHMEHYAAGLNKAAVKMHWKLVIWTRSACPAADVTVYAPALKRTYTECDEWRSLTISRIQDLHPDLVLISESDNSPGDAVPNRRWADGVDKTVRSLVSRKIPVTFLLDTPYPGVDIPECISNHLTDVDSCIFSRSRAFKYPSRRQTATIAAKNAGANVVDPVIWFCAQQCPVVVGNIVVWRDTGHMTATYSRWLAPVLATLLASSSGPSRKAV